MTREEFQYWRIRGQTAEVFDKLREWRNRTAESILVHEFTDCNMSRLNNMQGRLQTLDAILDDDTLWEVTS